MVFYNSFLPEIATPDRFDRLSAKGFTLGYIGSVLLLIQNLTMLLKPEWYGGIGGEMAARVSFLTVGLWWLLFAQIPLHYLPDSIAKEKEHRIFAVTDVVWFCIHATSETDIDKIDDVLLEKGA